MVEGPTVSRAGLCILAQFNFLFCDHQRPAHDGAANGAPAAEALVDLGRQRSLFPQGVLGFDMWIRDTAYGHPVWRSSMIWLHN